MPQYLTQLLHSNIILILNSVLSTYQSTLYLSIYLSANYLSVFLSSCVLFVWEMHLFQYKFVPIDHCLIYLQFHCLISLGSPGHPPYRQGFLDCMKLSGTPFYDYPGINTKSSNRYVGNLCIKSKIRQNFILHRHR